jgi:hypothetical protein
MTFEEFAAARLGAVVRFAAVLAGERALAEDIVQEVLIRAHARWDRIGCLDVPEAYVRKMVVNEYLSWRRRSWRLVPAGALEAGPDRPGRDPAVDHAERDAESDLAEALAALERYAPDPDTVLRGLRGHPRRRTIRWRRPLTVAAIASAAAAALVVALLAPVGRQAPPRLPSASSVATAMLTAFDSVSGDVEYETQTGFNRGVKVDEYQSWSWPAQPVPGQRQLNRTVYSGTSPVSTAVKLTEDRGIEAVVPPRGRGLVRGQVTMVCFLGSGQTGCGYGNRNTLPGTWSRFTATVGVGSDIGPGAIFDPHTLVSDISSGAWQVVGRTQLDGQQAIELSETDRGDNNTALEPLPVRLWVNAQTYLPIRLVIGVGGGGQGIAVQDFRYLPPTPANLALLRVPIPAGYPRR